MSNTTVYKQVRRDGSLICEGNIENGKEEGLWTWKYSNGNVSRQGTYVKGLEEGLWVSNYKNGNVYIKETFLNGLEEGIREEFYPEGQLKSRVHLSSGKVTFAEDFNKDGSPKKGSLLMDYEIKEALFDPF